jgi:diaminopimelate decarboxylase
VATIQTFNGDGVDSENTALVVESPNLSIKPVTIGTNDKNHITLAGLDLVDLADNYGTPLWVMDEQTIKQAIQAVKAGLDDYPDARVAYAGKAFLCSAMCHLLKELQVGLDVVSEGELYTATQAQFPADMLLLHGNNKSPREIEDALNYGDVRIVVDSRSELEMVAAIARKLGRKARIFLRMIPGIEPDTHPHIRTGQDLSKFGIAIEELDSLIPYIKRFNLELDLIGLHAHIGSGVSQLDPFLKLPGVMTELLKKLKDQHEIVLPELDLGGGMSITFTEKDKPVGLYEWSREIAHATMSSLSKHGLVAPRLWLEPGKAIVGTSGITLYRVGHIKNLTDGSVCIAVDGGMADNPRPITYQADYLVEIANRANAQTSSTRAQLVGRFCEQGDVLIKETYIPAKTGDVVAVYGTGCYNYSQSSNYNRVATPACVLVSNGKADIIIERQTKEDLLSKDRVPDRFLKSQQKSSE